MTHQDRPDLDQKRIAVLILAAGEGLRMGQIPKCLIQLNHAPLILRQIQALRLAGLDQISVVTGYFHEQIEAAIASEDVRMIRNPEPERGQQHSVRLGLEAMAHEAELVMIVLADQPLLETADFNELIAAFAKRPAHTQIMYPVVGDQRGNPVLMSALVIEAFLQASCEVSCRQYIDTHGESVFRYQSSNDHFIVDLDTPNDLVTLAKRTGYPVST